MEYDFIRIIGALFSLILGAFALQKYLRVDYEKKIKQLEKAVAEKIIKIEKLLDSHSKQIHKGSIHQAELNTLTHYIKESIERIDNKIDELSKKLHV